MIPFSFAYIVPDSLAEAVQAYRDCVNLGKKPLYYAGGTEIITMGRVNSIRFDAVIDLKRIPDMYGLTEDGNQMSIGAAETLKDVACWQGFPLLTKCCQRVADHTSQCKITLGGNIAGTVIYHETALALLLAHAKAVIHGPEGSREEKLERLFCPKLSLKAGELLVRFIMDKRFAGLDYIHVKQVESEKIGYPLFTLAALKDGEGMEAAVGGLYAFPVWAHFTLEDIASVGKCMDRLCGWRKEEPINDTMGSAEYRRFRLGQSLEAALKKLVGGIS